MSYSGQNQGRMDHELESAVRNRYQFKVYYRAKKNTSFTFLGSTRDSKIISERCVSVGHNADTSERLKLRLFIPKEQVVNKKVPSISSGTGRYKYDILHQNMIGDRKMNPMLGFYTIKE